MQPFTFSNQAVAFSDQAVTFSNQAVTFRDQAIPLENRAVPLGKEALALPIELFDPITGKDCFGRSGEIRPRQRLLDPHEIGSQPITFGGREPDLGPGLPRCCPRRLRLGGQIDDPEIGIAQPALAGSKCSFACRDECLRLSE